MAERPASATRASRYAAAGVDLVAADEAVDRLKDHARSTFRPEVLSDIGGFGGLVALPAGYREPVLVSSTDGVGTKLKVAEAAGRFDTIGIDLVAMCVDDIAVQGADPLFFLDYLGVGRLDPAVVEEIVAGIAEGCRQAGCALVGGEIAEHGPGHSLDLAGFVVGLVERSALLTGGAIQSGDVLLGILSPGLRSNGYSLARQVLLPRDELLDDPAWDGADVSWPTSCCGRRSSTRRRWRPCGARWPSTASPTSPAAVSRATCSACSPPTVDAVVRRGSWPVPRIFTELQRRGEITDAEMAEVFNLGVGMVAVVGAAEAADAVACLGRSGVEGVVIGEVVSGTGSVRLA